VKAFHEACRAGSRARRVTATEDVVAKVRCTVLTGFLGAGKTTLLNRILTRHTDAPIAVIVNEFGEVGIDAQLVVGAEEDILELNNGCICCTVRGDLTRAIGNILGSGRPISYILIETTGLADPAPIIQSFVLDETLRAATDLDAIVTIVDAKYVIDQLKNDQAREQVAFADVILINKIDLVMAAEVERVNRIVTSLNPLAHIYRTRDCEIDLSRVMRVGAFDLRNALRLDPDLLSDSAHQHDAEITAASIRTPGPIDPGRFSRWLNQLVQAQGKDLLRIKGIVDMVGESRRYVFHGVHMTLDGRPGKPWGPNDSRTNELVFIGRRLDAVALRRGFDNCLATELSQAC